MFLELSQFKLNEALLILHGNENFFLALKT